MSQHKSNNKCNIHHINGLKDRNHMVLVGDAEKAFNKIQHSFMVKVMERLGVEG